MGNTVFSGLPRERGSDTDISTMVAKTSDTILSKLQKSNLHFLRNKNNTMIQAGMND